MSLHETSLLVVTHLDNYVRYVQHRFLFSSTLKHSNLPWPSLHPPFNNFCCGLHFGSYILYRNNRIFPKRWALWVFRCYRSLQENQSLLDKKKPAYSRSIQGKLVSPLHSPTYPDRALPVPPAATANYESHQLGLTVCLMDCVSVIGHQTTHSVTSHRAK